MDAGNKGVTEMDTTGSRILSCLYTENIQSETQLHDRFVAMNVACVAAGHNRAGAHRFYRFTRTSRGA
jgi:hypothetical protein